MIRRVPDVRQVNGYYCGPAVVEAVATCFGHCHRQPYWAEKLGTSSEQGTHPLQITRVLRGLGLEVDFVEGMTVDRLKGHVRQGHVVIVDFQAWGDPPCRDYGTAWEDGHYGIVVGFNDEVVLIEDPSLLGALGYVRWDDFERRWHDYEIEDGKRREYRRLGIVVKTRPAHRAMFARIE